MPDQRDGTGERCLPFRAIYGDPPARLALGAPDPQHDEPLADCIPLPLWCSKISPGGVSLVTVGSGKGYYPLVHTRIREE
jgi:hypothetical protein